MEIGYKSYLENVKSDVGAFVYSNGDGVSFEDAFTDYGINCLESIGKSEGAVVLSYLHPNSLGGVDWKINGYCLRDEFKDDDTKKTYFETLDLYITFFNHTTFDYSIGKDDFTKSINQVKKFLNASLKGHIDYIDPAQVELNALLKVILKNRYDFGRINIYFLINGNSKHDLEVTKIKGFEELDVYIHVWDLPRFYKAFRSNSSRESIPIDFKDYLEFMQEGIPCLRVPEIDESFECYLAIIPGSVLSKLYNAYSSELLESNVRAFLGEKGKYNSGIIKTIKENPQMFLPYNNGITATAESVETEIVDNQLLIRKLVDFQIVNGGQTTASLFYTQKKHKDVDLSKVFVQMKLTVIKDVEQKNIEVPNIAKFANRQNKVNEADFSSSNPHFVMIESLSRKKYVINPTNRKLSTLWYFERVNGQYKASFNKIEKKKQAQFNEQNPSSQKFTKENIGQFINIWDLEPYYVARGKQQNFVFYIKKITEQVKRNKLPGENFYKKLISNAILYKTTDKLFGRKNIDAIGDTNSKALFVAYTLSYFHYLTENRLDLWKIYEEQIIREPIQKLLREMLIFVHQFLLQSANNTLMSEFGKKESTWDLLKLAGYEIHTDTLIEYFITREEVEQRENEKEIDNSSNDDTLFLISEIYKQGIKFWEGFKFYLNDNPIENIDWEIIFNIVKKLKENKNLLQREIQTGKKVLGFINENLELIEHIRNLSKITESQNIVDIKVLYDRLKLLSNNEWDKIISIGEQKSIFHSNELLNIKSVQMSLKKNELLKEQSIIKAHESVLKLRKYGVIL